MNCHDTERHYYVDQTVKDMIAKWGRRWAPKRLIHNKSACLHRGSAWRAASSVILFIVPAAASQEQMASMVR